jgi:hypothetical protein
MKAVSKKTSLMVKESYLLKMVINIKGILKMVSIMEKENIKLCNKVHIKVTLKTVSMMAKEYSNGKMIIIIKAIIEME